VHFSKVVRNFCEIKKKEGQAEEWNDDRRLFFWLDRAKKKNTCVSYFF
jgi:hypothetical protein